jgi:hypothetical protein
MVGTVPCTLEPRSQRPANMDIAVEKGPEDQHKRPRLMSSVKRSIVAPGYATVCREIQSGTKEGSDAWQGREV